MIALFWLFLALTVSPFKSKNRLAAENAALRHQLIVLLSFPKIPSGGISRGEAESAHYPVRCSRSSIY
jgi:hypothetical protein